MKAVIMAGGEGQRLRPLTCTVPKPMAKILGKPIIEYIFDLLCRNGVSQAAVTLGYMPHTVERSYECGYKNLMLDFVREDEPLGTAGSVKKAAAGFKEPFVVISGDAMCDFDLEKIMLFHKASNAKITIVAVDAADPREYGVIKVNENNRVTGFVEKPSWNQAISSLVNTGVYIIDPECLELIPNGKKYDFASDLFPLMLERNMPVYCYHSNEYWCDIGNIDAYLKCQRDAFDRKITIPFSPSAEGIYAKSKLPKGDYTIVPPVYIGENTEISDGAVIGPYAVVDDKCFIGKNARVKYSVVLENSWLASGASATGAVVCSGSALKNRASLFESSAVGSGSVIGEDAKVMSGIYVWPGKIVGAGVNLNSNLKYGSVKSEILNENGVDESGGIRLNAEACVKLGCAIGNTRNEAKIGIGFDGTKTADTMRLALIAGAAESGSTIWNFGECFEAQLKFLVNICGLDAGLFVNGASEKSIGICGEGGLSITRTLERKIENGIIKGEFREASENEIREITDMSSIKLLYTQELLKQAPYRLNGIGISFESDNKSIKNLLSDCALKLGAHESDELIFKINASGSSITAITEKNNVEHEKLIAVCCLNEMKNGRDIAVPYDAPAFLDSLARKYGRRAYRYLSTPADNSDSVARRLAAKQIFVRDALFLSIRLLSVVKERECSFDELVNELPEIYIVKKTVPVSFSPSRLSILMNAENSNDIKNDFEGIRLVRNSGNLLIVPERTGDRIRILAEADTMEAADELCADVEDIIEKAEDKIR